MKNLNTYESFGINENAQRLTPAENAVIDLIKKKNKSITITATDKDPGAGEFHVTLIGKRDGINFEGKLMLTAIRELVDWTKPEVAKMTDYPKMALDGDWSAVRDSSNIEGIFDKFVVDKMKVMDLAKKQEYIGESKKTDSIFAIIDNKNKKILVLDESNWKNFSEQIKGLKSAIEGTSDNTIELDVITKSDMQYYLNNGYKKSRNMSLTLNLL